MSLEDLNNLALRRSLYYPAAEIYANAPGGFLDYGPLGLKIRNQIVNAWRQQFVEKEGFMEVDGAQILPEPVFQASGHIQNFNDPLVQCTKCHSVYRADKLLEERLEKNIPESTPVKELHKLIEKEKIQCAKCKGKLGEVKSFNMMMALKIGATGTQNAYLRPETCQTIFLNFDRLYKTMRTPLPLGISQVGKSFRNEIAPRNALLRAREFYQMETEIFFNPQRISEAKNWESVKKYPLQLMLHTGKKKDTVMPVACADAVQEKIVSGKLVAYVLARVQQWYEYLGIPREKLRFRELEKDARAFYAAETWDFEVETSQGWLELCACNYRTDYDLKRHAEYSKKDLRVKEEGSKEAFIPHVFEVSMGLDRLFFTVLDLGLKTKKRGPEERTYLDIKPFLAPYLVAVFPLVNKDGLPEKAHEIYDELRTRSLDAFFDSTGSIGKRYARVDEIGAPFAITIDHQTLKDQTVTLRERNSLQQKRVPVFELHRKLWDLKTERAAFESIKE
ncbi:MAG: glycine--tRNA ligase [Candidatus Diapherotrites archaeon]|nr:glycine--tRNA ligase [Candidatus Diapherotrites archaeon]